MQTVYVLIALITAYLLGSIPFGLIVVKIKNGKDIRKIQSGRTGGTNAMRAAGFWAGLITSLLDIAKSAGSIWIARSFFPGNYWIEIFAGIVAIIGHNHSIYLIERDQNGKIRMRGGAGGTPAAGGAVGLWPVSFFIIVPMAALILFGIGYASLATISIPIMAAIIFAIRAALGYSPWVYVLYGVFAEILLLWALRPNIARLIKGTERVVGWRAKREVKSKSSPQAIKPHTDKALKNS